MQENIVFLKGTPEKAIPKNNKTKFKTTDRFWSTVQRWLIQL